MKKVFVMIVLVFSILSACSSFELSFSEINNVPKDVQNHIDSSLQLQLIYDGKNRSYIVFQSDGDVEADLNREENVVTLMFDTSNEKADQKKQYVYLLTTDEDIDTIGVLVNGEPQPFDVVTTGI